jgi:MFS family permease
LLLALIAFLAVSALPERQFLSWGWRIPFLLSLVLVVVGLVVRRAVAETPAFAQLRQARAAARQPLLEVLRHHHRSVLLAAGSRCAEIGFLNILTVFVLTYATQSLGLPRTAVLGAIMVVTLLFLILVPGFGALSDRLGRRPVYLSGALAGTAVALPAMLLIDSANLGLLVLGMVAASLGPAAMLGSQATFFAELFQTRVRYTGSSMGFQLGSVLAGGLSPLIAASLAVTYGGLLAVGVFMIGFGVVALGCVWAMAGQQPSADGVRAAHAEAS